MLRGSFWALCALLWTATLPAAVSAALVIDILADVPPPGQPEGLAVAPDGTVYVGTNAQFGTPQNTDPSILFAFAGDGSLVDQFEIQGQNVNASHGLEGIAVGGDGAVYVLDRNPARVLRIYPPTRAQTTYATFRNVPPCGPGGPNGECSATASDQNTLPNYPVFAPDGTLYVSDSAQGLIWRIPPGGGPAEIWLTDPALDSPVGPNGLQFLPDGTTLLMVLTGSQESGPAITTGKIFELPVLPDGSPGPLSLFWESLPLDAPDGLSIANSGNVYVALALADQILKLGPDGSELERAPANQAENLLLEVPLDDPASTGFLGTRVMMTNQSLFLGNPDSWVVYDIETGETGLPLYHPVPEPDALPLLLCGSLLVAGLTGRLRGGRTRPTTR